MSWPIKMIDLNQSFLSFCCESFKKYLQFLDATLVNSKVFQQKLQVPSTNLVKSEEIA